MGDFLLPVGLVVRLSGLCAPHLLSRREDGNSHGKLGDVLVPRGRGFTDRVGTERGGQNLEGRT